MLCLSPSALPAVQRCPASQELQGLLCWCSEHQHQSHSPPAMHMLSPASVCNSCRVHLSHTLVSHPSECHVCDAVCADLDSLILPLIPVGTVLVGLWCCHRCRVHVEGVVFLGVLAGQGGNINSFCLLNNEQKSVHKFFRQIPAFLFKMSFSDFFLKA